MAKREDQECIIMADREKIKAFVQDELGCGCAEEVFKIIELRQESMAGESYGRVNIGNRLLIYIFETDDREFVARELSRLVRAGMDERNTLGFNRFRLVLATGDARVGTASMKAYKDLDFADDRTFLHVVKKEQIAF